MRIELPSGTPAELAQPDQPADRGLVLVPDIMGLRPLFDDHCTRLAAEQRWVVCAPEPFPGREHLTLDERQAAAHTLDDHRVLGDLVAAATATGCASVGVIGFCMGGMYAMKASATGRFDRCVAFYGMFRVPDHWRGAGQHEPMEALRAPGRSPVLALVGTDDPYTPPADVAEAEGCGVEVVRYEGANHGFVHDPSRPTHRPADAADAWARAIAFLTG